MSVPHTVRFPALYNSAWLREHYVDQRLSCREIADSLGCSRGLVENALKRAQIPRRGRYPDKWKPKECAVCGQIFTPVGPAGVFCSDRCRFGEKPCAQCGTTFTPGSGNKAEREAQRFCSRRCRYAYANEHGRSVNGDGYVTIPRPATMSVSPNGDGYTRINLGSGRGRILEHRYVMEQVLGRELLPGENVHHKNGRRDDNRPANLELWITKQPKGQQVEDVVEWAVEMLRRYAPDRLR